MAKAWAVAGAAITIAANLAGAAVKAGDQAQAARSPFDPPVVAKGQKAAKPAAKTVAKSKPTPKTIDASPAFPGEDEEAVEPPRALAPVAAPAAAPVATAVASRAHARKGRMPSAFLQARVDALWAEVKSRPARSAFAVAGGAKISIQAAASKQDWLKEAYARNLVDASRESLMLADKLMLAEILKRDLGAAEAERFYPKTMGLKQFLEKRKLVDAAGRMAADPDAVEQALADEFPFGFVARPAVGVAPRETERGLFARSDQLVTELFAPQSAVYAPSSFRAPIRSHILGVVASGEAVVLQEDVVLRADARKRLKARSMGIARVHTYEDRVVPGAAPAPWVRDERVSEAEERRAEAFVAELLGRLSPRLLARQAWSVDVATLDNGDLRVMDVVTNRGKRGAWSGYLDQPRVIGAYSRLWEDRCGVAFEGFSGTVLRHGLANYFPYWGKRIEAAKAPWKKALALLPPAP